MKLPSGKIVTKNTPIYPGSNFTWGEATKNCTRHIQSLVLSNNLIISDRDIEKKIVATAKKLDAIRDAIGGRPIHINSWYRPQHVNQKVGGSRHSRHQYGDGVDIRSNYRPPRQIYSLLEPYHNSGGIARYHSFVHIDWRGYKARW